MLQVARYDDASLPIIEGDDHSINPQQTALNAAAASWQQSMAIAAAAALQKP